MRGKGIRLQRKYSWTQQPNGNYCIFDVEIFKVFDEREVEPGKKISSASANDLNFLKEIFEMKKQEKSFYPRIHIGHHDKGVSNMEDAGFLDFFYVRDGLLYSDLAEIPESVFLQIKAGYYPYRSVEIAHDGSIASLALLRSRHPVFDFPILALEEEPREPSAQAIEIFQKRNFVIFGGKTMPFPEGGMDSLANIDSMTGKIPQSQREQMDKNASIRAKDDQGFKNATQEDRRAGMYPTSFEEGPDTPNAEGPESLANFQKMYQGFSHFMEESSSTNEKICSILGKICEKLGIGDFSQDISGAENVGGVPPNSIAKDANYQALTRQISELSKQFSMMQNKSTLQQDVETLRSICQENHIDFQQEQPYFSTIQDPSQRKKYLEHIRTAHRYSSPHPATQFANEVSSNFVQTTSAPNSQIADMFQAEPQRVKSLAMTLAQNWEDTCRENSDPRFLQRNPDKVQFVKTMIEREKRIPGHCKMMGYI